jgi:metallo-beta-lactamase class B
VLVDTGWTAQVTREILAFGDTHLKEKWALAVITHFHVDRSGGLAALAERQIPVQAAPKTLELLAQSQPALASLPAIAFTEQTGDEESYALFFPGAGHSQDNIVVWFPKQKVLFGGCFVKEMAAPSLGFTADADLERWPAAIAAVERRYQDVRLVVPGHGQPGPAALLAHTRALLAAQTPSGTRAAP